MSDAVRWFARSGLPRTPLGMLLGALLGILLAPSAPLAQSWVDATLTGDLLEDHQPEVSVSGSVLVGVMAPSTAKALRTNHIFVAATSNESMRKICLRVMSRDGSYSSRNDYGVPEISSDVRLRLPYPTGYRSILETYGEGDVALAATLGSCDDVSQTYLTVASEKPSPSDGIQVYVNSFGATDVAYRVGPDDPATPPKPCKEIEGKRRTAFDFVCVIPSLPGGSAEVSLLRERFGRSQPDVKITVRDPR